MNLFINEDSIVKWVEKNNGVIMSRKICNIDHINLTECPENTFVCITGSNEVLNFFFNKKINYFKNKIILITIETDGFDMLEKYVNHKLVKHWFTWNKSYQHNKVTCIPMGLNFDRQQIILDGFLKTNILPDTKDRKLLCMNCNLNTNKFRQILSNNIKNIWKNFCDILPTIPFIKEYWNNSYIEYKILISVTDPKCYDMISKYKFILSPEGAGLDCHRTWEALYLNIIPIVLSSSINELYEDLPILVVNSWNDITEKFLNDKYEEINMKKERGEYKLDKMYLNYWLDKIMEKI